MHTHCFMHKSLLFFHEDLLTTMKRQKEKDRGKEMEAKEYHAILTRGMFAAVVIVDGTVLGPKS